MTRVGEASVRGPPPTMSKPIKSGFLLGKSGFPMLPYLDQIVDGDAFFNRITVQYTSASTRRWLLDHQLHDADWPGFHQKDDRFNAKKVAWYKVQ